MHVVNRPLLNLFICILVGPELAATGCLVTRSVGPIPADVCGCSQPERLIPAQGTAFIRRSDRLRPPRSKGAAARTEASPGFGVNSTNDSAGKLWFTAHDASATTGRLRTVEYVGPSRSSRVLRAGAGPGPNGAFLGSFGRLGQCKISCWDDAPVGQAASTMHLLRVITVHQKISIIGPSGIVSGDRNRNRYPQSWQGSSVRWNASRSDRGRTRTSTTGTRRARASFQNGVFGT